MKLSKKKTFEKDEVIGKSHSEYKHWGALLEEKFENIIKQTRKILFLRLPKS